MARTTTSRSHPASGRRSTPWQSRSSAGCPGRGQLLDPTPGDGPQLSAFTGFVRAITEPVVRAVLNQPSREAATVDSLYDRVRARLLAEPDRYLWRYIVVAVLLTRR